MKPDKVTDPRRTSSTIGGVVYRDTRKRRKANFTPEYQAWLSRQRLKRRIAR